MPKLPRLPKVPGLPGKLSIPSMPNLPTLPAVPRIPAVDRVLGKLPLSALAGIPKRTKLIIAGGLAVVVVAAFVLFLALGGSGSGSTQSTATEASVDEPARTPVAEESTDSGTPVQTPVTQSATPAATPTPTAILEPEESAVISVDTTWTKDRSPYTLTGTVRILKGATLTIEPGVTVTKPRSGHMFWLSGNLYAHGTADEMIVFDGGGNSDFFWARDSDEDTLLDLEYCRIRNGFSLWDSYGGVGALSLRHSDLTDLSRSSYLWYPGTACYIEYNSFTKTAGFSIGHQHDAKVYVQYNSFNEKYPGLPESDDYWVQNWGSFNQSETIVRYNSFDPSDGVALRLVCGNETSAMIATDNYWGTRDEEQIRQMVYDQDDDPACGSHIEYVPYLTQSASPTATP